MIDQGARVASLVKDELKTATLGNMGFGYAVGHGFGAMPLENGQVYMGALWTVTVTMRNPLLGQPDIARSVPIPGPMPPDSIFRQAVQKLAEACTRDHDEAIAMPQGKELAK